MITFFKTKDYLVDICFLLVAGWFRFVQQRQRCPVGSIQGRSPSLIKLW